MKRGGSQSSASQRRVDEDDAEAEAAVHERLGLRLVQLAHGLDRRPARSGRSRSSATMRMPLRAARLPEVRQVALADQRLLDQHADLGVPALGQQVGPEDRLVGHRALRNENVHSPSQSSEPVTLIAGTRKRSSIASRVGTQLSVMRRAEDGEAALVDELAVRVDHRLDRPLRQALDLAEDDLDRRGRCTPCSSPSSKTSSKVCVKSSRISSGKPSRQPEVEQVAELDRLGVLS